MRVLLVDLSSRFGGADIRVLQTAKALADRCDLAVAVLAGSPVHEELAAAGVRAIPVRRSRRDPRVAIEIAEHLRRFRPDVVDAHNPQSQLWGLAAAAATGVPGRLATVHSEYRIAHGGIVRGRLHETALRLGNRTGAHFLAVSGTVQRYVAGLGVPMERLHLSRNGMEPLWGPVVPAGLRSRLGIAPGEPLVGIVGRIDPVKGHDTLAAAVARLGREGRTVHVAVVGDGPGEGALRALVDGLGIGGQVHFLGFRRDVTAVLADLDVVCAPSRSEGLPYSVLEAARQGVPVIASRVGGLAELLEDDVTAVLVPPDEPEMLAAAIGALLADGRRRWRLGEAGRRMVAERFQLSRMVDETLEVYRAICGRPAPRPVGERPVPESVS